MRRNSQNLCLRVSCCLAALLLVLAGRTAAVAEASGIAPQSYAALQWRLIGPFRGGRVLAVSGVAGNPALFYFGSVDGGVWKSDDAGRTWTPIFDRQPVGSIGALAVAPSDPQTLYAGSGEADMRSDISYGNGMYKSSDAGRSWKRIGLDDTRQIARIVVDPNDAKRVFVAALGHAYAANSERGVFRTLDGGATWRKVLFINSDTGAVDLAIDPADASHLIAALWQTRRPPWNIYPPSNGPGSGLYQSSDGGTSWQHLAGNGLPREGLGRMGLAFAPSDPRRVYLVADAKRGGVYRSDDGGATWTLSDPDARLWDRGWYFGGITVDPKNSNVVYVSDTALYRSLDGGRSFTAIKGSPDGDDFHTLWIDPTDSGRMILGCDQGASVSLNFGRTWSSWYNQPTGQFYHVITDARAPFWLFGAQQDSGAAAALERSPYDSLTFRDWRALVAGGESDMLAPDPQDPNTVYGGRVDRYDLASSQTQNIDPTLSYPTRLWRQTWTLPLAFSWADKQSLYFGRQVLFRTQNGGRSWSIISPDLTRPDPGVPAALDAATAVDTLGAGRRRGVIYAVAPSPIRAREIWAGTDDGKIWLTKDGGAHWRDVTPACVGPWSKVTMLDASWFDAGEAYAAIDRHRLDDLQPYLVRTRDGGATWQSIAAGIPAGSYLNAIRSDPKRRSLLYAGTETGPYISFDDGGSWQPLQLNLPTVSIRDFSVRGNSLAIATHGRGLWVLDDLVPLRQMDARIASAGAWLFSPASTVRFRPGDDQGERLPPDEPAAPNPPQGAIIDYELGARAVEPVRLRVTDSQGRTVRQWSSSDRVAAANPNDVPYDPRYIQTSSPPRAATGLNQFVWDLRYAALAGVALDGQKPGEGPWAPPGRYLVLMSAGRHTFRRALNVLRDPRISLRDADLQAQFDFAWSIEHWRVRGASAYHAVHAWLRTMQKTRAFRAGSCSAQRASATLGHLSQLAGGPPPSSPDNSAGYPELNLDSLYSLTGSLGTLELAVESADAAPTPDQRLAFTSITTRLAARIRGVPTTACGFALRR